MEGAAAFQQAFARPPPEAARVPSPQAPPMQQVLSHDAVAAALATPPEVIQDQCPRPRSPGSRRREPSVDHVVSPLPGLASSFAQTSVRGARVEERGPNECSHVITSEHVCLASAKNGSPERPSGAGSAARARSPVQAQAIALLQMAMQHGELSHAPNEGSAASPPGAQLSLVLSEQLIEAVGRGDVATAQRLIEAGANVNHSTQDGSCAAALATVQGRPPALLQMLLEHRASIDMGESGNLTLVHLWSTGTMRTRKQQEEARAKMRLLLEHRADVNAHVQLSGNTPLHLAAEEFQRCRTEADEIGQAGLPREALENLIGLRFQCQHLLQVRSDPAAKNLMGQSPLDLVDAKYHRELWSSPKASPAAANVP